MSIPGQPKNFSSSSTRVLCFLPNPSHPRLPRAWPAPPLPPSSPTRRPPLLLPPPRSRRTISFLSPPPARVACSSAPCTFSEQATTIVAAPSRFAEMEGSDSVTSPDLELVAGTLDLDTIFDADMEDFVHGRRTLFAVCAYTLLKATPGLRALVDDIPHHSYDTGHVGGNLCFRCNMKELNKYILMDYSEIQRITSSLFIFRNWEPKTVTVHVQALMDELLCEMDHWCLEKDYENTMNMVLMQVSFRDQINDLLLFGSSTKWGCYNCAAHFTCMVCSKSICMDGRSVSEFEEEHYLDCYECQIRTGYKRMKACKLPKVLNFYEVSGLLPEFRILNQDYGLTCVMPERNKACLYCLLEPMNWTRVDAAELKAQLCPLGPALPPAILGKCAIAMYQRI